MSSSFVVVICHGSYHTPEPYQPFRDALKASGIESYCPQLPSSDLTKMNVGDIANPNYDLDIPSGGYPQPSEDIKVINKLLEELITKDGKDVLLLGHSSGGFTATASAIPEFQAKSRKERGLSGGIIGIFYACGFLIPVGESVHSFFQPKDGSPPVVPPYCKFHVSGCRTWSSPFDDSVNVDMSMANNSSLTETWLPWCCLCCRRSKVLLQWIR